MFLKRDSVPKIRTENAFIYRLVVYTFLYIITAILVFFTLLYFSRTFLRDGEGNIDGIAQLYPSYFRLKQIISDVIAGEGIDVWSWYLGLGDDMFMTFQGKLFNPLTYIILLFPEEHLDTGYNIMVIISQYLSGLMFIIFADKVGIGKKQQVAGAMCYAFCGWILIAMVRQGPFLIATILLPLIMLGVEKILKHESPVLFILTVAIHIYCSVLWSYVAAIVVIIYFVLRYFYYNQNKNIKAFSKSIMMFIAYGIIGIMIAGISIIQNVVKLGGATTESTIKQHALYTLKDYLTVPAGFFELSEIHNLYSLITLPAICIILIPIIIKNLKKKNTAAVMAVLFFVLGLLPVTGSVFNGLSYSVGRWYYVIAFFMIWAAMEVLNSETFSSIKNIKIMLVWIIGLAVWNVGICYMIFEIVSIYSALATIIGAVCGIIIIVCGYCYCNQKECNSANKVNNKRVLSFIVTVCLVVNVVGYGNIMLFPWFSDFIFKLSPTGKILEKYDSSSENATVVLQNNDKSFFRTDQVDGYSDTRIARVRANENVYFGNRTIYTYFSSMKSSWHEFNKAMGNNAGYFDRTTSYSNDNRAGLDFLMGVKYFLGDSDNKKNGATDYAPYGFSYKETIKGVDVLENKYCIGLGTTYDKYITESEFMEYSYLEREQIMMQAIVVPDEYEDTLDGAEHISKESIKTDIKEIQYEITDESNVKIEDGCMTVYNNDGSFNLSLPKIKNCQIVLSFENLIREECDYETSLKLAGTSIEALDKNRMTDFINRVSYEDDEKFKITATRGNVVKAASNRKGKNQGFNDIVDYNINIGYYDSLSGDINVSIDRLGKYTFDSIKVYAVPMEIYDTSAQRLVQRAITIDSYENDSIIGSAETAEDSIMYLSILNAPGWKVYIDGKETEKINDVNISFTGVIIPAGIHEIELVYNSPYVKEGMIITGAGITLLICVSVIYCRRKRRMES